MKKYMMTKGQMKRQFAEFCSAIEKFIPRFKKEIDEKEMIYIPARDLAKEMGPEFLDKHPVSFYMGTKLCLWDNGIYVGDKRS